MKVLKIFALVAPIVVLASCAGFTKSSVVMYPPSSEVMITTGQYQGEYDSLGYVTVSKFKMVFTGIWTLGGVKSVGITAGEWSSSSVAKSLSSVVQNQFAAKAQELGGDAVINVKFYGKRFYSHWTGLIFPAFLPIGNIIGFFPEGSTWKGEVIKRKGAL